MIWAFNLLLILVGGPLLGSSLFVFGMIITVEGRQELILSEYFLFLAVWSISLILFSLIYIRRASWLRTVGRYRSWSLFKSYLIEKHDSPSIPTQRKIEFLSWVILSGKSSRFHLKHCKNIYKRIRRKFHRNDELKDNLDCLTWYYNEEPFNDIEFLLFLMGISQNFESE